MIAAGPEPAARRSQARAGPPAAAPGFKLAIPVPVLGSAGDSEPAPVTVTGVTVRVPSRVGRRLVVASRRPARLAAPAGADGRPPAARDLPD